MTSYQRQALAGRAARRDHRYCAGRVCGGVVRRLRRDWAAGGGYTGLYRGQTLMEGCFMKGYHRLPSIPLI